MGSFGSENESIVLFNWMSILEELGGSLDSNLEYPIEDIIHEIRKQEGGTERILTECMHNDTMSCTHHDVAEVYKSITQDLFIRQHSTQKIFKYNLHTQLWEEPTNLKGEFIIVMTTYMKILDVGSINKHLFPKMKDTDYFEMKCKYKNFIKQDSTINSILNIFKSIVIEVDTQFDLEPKYSKSICFRNGVYDLDSVHSDSFSRRDRYSMFTKSLDFDYSDVYNESHFDEIDDFFKKIQPDYEQRKFTVSFLKYCLKGGNPKCIFKMNIGYTASNGKSSEMNIHEMVFPLYTYKLNKATFNKSCTKIHKYMSKLVSSPIRLAYINELDDSKLDEDFLKDVVDGKKLELEKMYSTMTEESILQCKIITTSNKDPNIDVDPGVLRRMTMQQYNSRFVQESEVDEEKHLYLNDPTWTEDRFTQDSYKLAYFHYLLTMPELYVPRANKTLVDDFVEDNDTFMSTLTERFEVTKNSKDKVQQQEVVTAFPEVSKQRLNRELKRLGITYDKNGSVNGIRKVYRGLKSIDIGICLSDPE